MEARAGRIDERLLIGAFVVGVAALWLAQDWLRPRVQSAAADALARPSRVPLGAEKPARSVEDIEALSRIMDEVARTWPSRPVSPEVADRLERFMQPGLPAETRIRAMRAGQVIGQERFRKVLLAAWTDPDPRVRRTAVAKADTDLDLWPHLVPSLKADPDPGVRSAWDMWMATIEFRTRTGRDPSTGQSVRPPPSPAR